MTITDGIGLKADTLQLVIANPGGSVAAPHTGDRLSPFGGYQDGAIRTFGDFIVDQVVHSGYPQEISISAQSADAMSTVKKQVSRDFRKEEYPTFGDIFRELASQASLSAVVSREVAAIQVEYETQAEEDPLECAARLCRKVDAIRSVKAGRMIVFPRGSGLTASGAMMPPIRVAPGNNLLSYSATWMSRPSYGSVKAVSYDRKKNRQSDQIESTGMDGPQFLIRDLYPSDEDARHAAKARAGELKRAQANAHFTINGDPGASAGASVIATGIEPGVDGRWFAKTVTHNFSATAPYTTDLECELPASGSRGTAARAKSSQPTAGAASSATGDVEPPQGPVYRTLLIDEQ